MKLNFKILIIVAIIILAVVILFYFMGNSKGQEQDVKKKSAIDSLFAIWLSVVGDGDKKTMLTNEVALKNELYDKLSLEEIDAISVYSTNLKLLLENKKRPFSPEFIGSLAYLTQNFNTAKDIISKTSFKDIFLNTATNVTAGNKQN